MRDFYAVENQSNLPELEPRPTPSLARLVTHAARLYLAPDRTALRPDRRSRARLLDDRPKGRT